MGEAVVVVRLVAVEENIKVKDSRFVLTLLLMSSALVAGCNRTQPVSAASATATTEPVKAAATPSVPRDYIEVSGPITVENQVDVAAQREGVVETIKVETGSPVRKGQLLAQLDNRQLVSDRVAAEAKMRSVEADAKNWEAEAKVLETDYKRAEEMWKAQLITQQQLEHARYKVVGSNYQTEREHQSYLNAEATLHSLDLELEKTRIVAPFDGVVARRYVRAGQKVAINDRLFWISATSPLIVKFTLPAEWMGHIRLGQEVSLLQPQAVDHGRSARITLLSPVVDPGSDTIDVQAEVNGPPGDLRPGMTATVRIKNRL